MSQGAERKDAGGDRLVLAPELSRRLGIARRTLANWIKEGVVPPPSKVRGRLYWREAVVDEFIRCMGA